MTVALLSIAVLIQVLIGCAYLLIGGFGGDRIAYPLMGIWAIASTVIVLTLVLVVRRRWRPAFGWLVPVAMLSTVLALPLVVGPIGGTGACTDARRSTLLSVPPYGGGAAEVSGGTTGLCWYPVMTTDPVERVVAYYRSHLRSDGWNVSVANQGPGSSEGPGSVIAGELDATRGGETLAVVYESVDGTNTISVQLLG